MLAGERDREERRTVYLGPSLSTENNYAGNVVVTSRYNVVTFLPKFLFEAFSKFANAYFLVVCTMQAIPLVSITDGVPLTLVPLSVVLFVEAVVTALEDRQRHKDDALANSSKCTTVEHGKTVQKRWNQLKVGDVVKIRNREAIPCDLLILACSDTPPQGVCYVETKSLDGETNLKLKQAPVETVELVSQNSVLGDEQSMDQAVSQRLVGTVVCESPNSHLDTFSGNLSLATGQEVPLSLKNILLRGCVVRSTDFVYGLVINAGHDTKIMKSMVSTKGKMAILDRTINRMLVGFLVLILSICILCAGLALDWHYVSEWDNSYLSTVPFSASDFFIRACTFFLLVAAMIPISLYVSMKILRVCQSVFVWWDVEMIHQGEDPLSGEPFKHRSKVRTMDLCDAIGQVSYVFSDKTGTLTNNVMEFRKMSMGGKSYGLGTTIIGVAAFERENKMKEANDARLFLEKMENDPHPRFVNFTEQQPQFGSQLEQGQIPGSREFLTALAICHEVLVEAVKTDDGKDTGKFRLSASSPDDQALVVAAGEFGFKFTNRGNGGRTIDVMETAPSKYIKGERYVDEEDKRPGRLVTYNLLETLEFTSTRKRASVIVSRSGTDQLLLFCKGADSEVYKRLTNPDSALARATNEHLLQFADDGLRTLTVAYKQLDSNQFAQWQEKYKAATSNVKEQEKRKHKQDNLIDQLMDELEQGLDLLGATAIEDKLQEKVPDTIKALAEAGIKLWVLTGDKQETAINIAWACQLIDHTMERIIINSGSAKTKADMITVLQNIQLVQDKRYALVIDGAALKLALKPETSKKHTAQDRECEHLLVALAVKMQSVICCRVSPKQKALVVDLVRSHLKNEITLAIGDGANDVGMIQSAHVGVGISGLEGMQAVNSADFALGRFYFLKRLLLVHGRNNYRRTSKLVVLILYKNVFMIIAQICFSIYNGFSGQKFYFQLGVEGYNLVFTNSVIITTLFDKDLPDRYLMQFPELYSLGREFQLMNFRVFWQWIGNAWYHAIFAFYFVFWFYQAPDQQDIWMMGNMLLTMVVVVANIKVALEVGSWNWIMSLGFLIVFVSWPLLALFFESPVFLSIRMFWEFQGVFTSILRDADAWLVFCFGLAALLTRDLAWKGIKREFFPELRHIMGEHAQRSGRPFNDMGVVDWTHPRATKATIAPQEEEGLL
ncbi:hypothetical protein BASA81_000138 [Batrachochytrium salamandrivorans]|nr:hypothetical protein BASA81_000138 [Batrachochytrium salamandrivorans]